MTQISVDYEVSSITLAKAAEKSLGDAEAIVEKFLTQAERDALSGTFGEYTSDLFALLPGEFERFQEQRDKLTGITNKTGDKDLREGRLQFTLKLDTETFVAPKVGLQHLIGILVGDIFSRGRSVFDPNARVIAKRVDIGIAKKAYQEEYVSRSHSIQQLRDLFRLDGTSTAPLRLPLMAFSFKPRTGFSREFVRRVTLGVLQTGFNLVELDTRNLQTAASDWCDFFITLAEEATKISTHVARFSPNLTMPATEAINIATRFKDAHPAGTPWVVKVDGGLDGLRTIQALRRHFEKDQQPIITCYPLLNRTLEERIGRDTLLDFLTLSGADIVYPGGTPRLSTKSVGIDLEQIESGYIRYRSIIDNDRPMPSIAGGIHAGQLAAYHEMFGPSVAYFLGGAVALHKRGAFAGAKLCMEVIRAAARMEGQAKPDYTQLLTKFAGIKDEYGVDPHFSTEPEQWEYQDPSRYLKGQIKRYVVRPRQRSK